MSVPHGILQDEKTTGKQAKIDTQIIAAADAA
jgi:hypothetical protein